LREAFLSLTSAGRAVYEELAPRALEFTASLSEAVSPTDHLAFDRAVKQLTERSAELVRDQISDVRDQRSDIGGQRSDGGDRGDR
jgi:DNA-binding MarR family transcriptional regulator